MKNSKKLIVLINLPLSSTYSYQNKGSFYPSTAIILIGSLLKKAGNEVKIIDGCYHENYLEILCNYLVDNKERLIFIGLSVMTPQVPVALKVSKEIKSSGTAS